MKHEVITFIQDLATNPSYFQHILRSHDGDCGYMSKSHNGTKHAFVIVFTVKHVPHFGKSTNGHRLRFHFGNFVVHQLPPTIYGHTARGEVRRVWGG